MRPIFHPSLVNGRYGDPTIYVETLFEKHSLLFDVGEIASSKGNSGVEAQVEGQSGLCGDHWGRPGVENRARLTRNEATGRTMPTAWELKMEIPDKGVWLDRW